MENQSFTITTMVTDAMTAAQVKSGDLAVLATPSMIALMEQAAMNCLKPHLEAGKTSVGVDLTVKHVAATPVAATIKVRASLVECYDKRASFTLMAYDDAGVIGEGTHTRAIVDRERFMAKVGGKFAEKAEA